MSMSGLKDKSKSHMEISSLILNLMGFFDLMPQVKKCCCVTDLKTATAIIAVLGIVSNPAATWAVVRHSYIIGMSCYVSTNVAHPDILDITVNKIVHFGFGRNAGLGPSCLLAPEPKLNKTEAPVRKMPPGDEQEHRAHFVGGVYVVGWCVLITDCVFVLVRAAFLTLMYHGSDRVISMVFIVVAILAVLISFVYSMLYISACTSVGGSFPLFEFFFSIIDVFIWSYWVLVVYSYRNTIPT